MLRYKNINTGLQKPIQVKPYMKGLPDIREYLRCHTSFPSSARHFH